MTHAECTIYALDHGVNVLLEKPMCVTLEEAVEIRKAEIKTGKTAEAEIVFSGRIEAGWHIYSTDLGSSGPTEASFHVNKADGIELVGKLMPRGKEKSHFDAMFGMNVRYFEGTILYVDLFRHDVRPVLLIPKQGAIFYRIQVSYDFF